MEQEREREPELELELEREGEQQRERAREQEQQRELAERERVTVTKYLDQIKKRLEAATPGPWHIGHVSQVGDGEESADIDGPNGEEIAHVFQRADQSLIASAPTDIYKLIRIVEVQQEALKAYCAITHTMRLDDEPFTVIERSEI